MRRDLEMGRYTCMNMSVVVRDMLWVVWTESSWRDMKVVLKDRKMVVIELSQAGMEESRDLNLNLRKMMYASEPK